MITKASALFDCKTGDDERNNQRSRVLVLLCEYRFSIEDIAMSLNCSESVVRSLLAGPYRSLYACQDDNPIRVVEPVSLRMLPPMKPAVALKPAPMSKEAIAGHLEKHGHELVREVCGWLYTLEASHADRQQAIEQAGLLLDESPLNEAGALDFQVNRVLLEVLGIRHSSRSANGSQNFGLLVGRWLACWIRFWISDPAIWNRALDRAFAHFELAAKTA
jgi:hypothetical protein